MGAEKSQIQEFYNAAVALQRAMEMSIAKDDPTSIWKYASFRSFARKYDQLAQAVVNLLRLPPILDKYNVEKLPTWSAISVAEHKAIFDEVFANVSILRAILEDRIGVQEKGALALNDFFRARLRPATLRTPEQERDIQDVVEQLLIGRGLQKGQDYDRESGRVKFSSKESIPDFIFPNLSLALEIKLVKTLQRVKEVIDEINADSISYLKIYKQLLFLVYDLGQIRDEVEFRHDLQRLENIDVLVIKH
jgi:hypothetical protein